MDAYRDDGRDDQTIISRLVSKYGLTQEEAKEYALPAVGATFYKTLWMPCVAF